jgi:hypothetical protein
LERQSPATHNVDQPSLSHNYQLPSEVTFRYVSIQLNSN